MRFVLLANARVPSEKAHPLQIMHMAEAFAAHGIETFLLYARRANTDAMREIKDPYAHYCIDRTFALVGFPCLDLIKRFTLDWPMFNRGPLRLLAHLIQLWTFTLSALVMGRRLSGDVVYSRDLFPLTLVALCWRHRNRTCFEAHTLPRSSISQILHLWALQRIDRVVVISSPLSRWYVTRGVPADRILVAHDAVRIATFASQSKACARRMLGLTPTAQIVCYLGHLYRWKGVDTLVAATAHMPDTIQIAIVGGVEPDSSRIRKLARGRCNVIMTGHLAPSDARRYLAAADVAVIPFSGQTVISREHTSPLKMFEYMASGVPIVASDLPSLREVLRDEHNALLVSADDEAALGAAVMRLLGDDVLADRLARTAHEEVAERTWNRRAARIVEFLALAQPA